MALPAVRLSAPPTLADIDALPPGVKGEIIDGVLYAVTRPRMAHQDLAGWIVSDLKAPFQSGRGGPGGWWIIPEPGIELPGAPEISPDIAGWKRERLPSMVRDRSITVVPDWVCEVLSPTTRGVHVLRKRPYYARVGVRHLWELDLDARAVTVYALDGPHWKELGSWGETDAVRLPPFEALELHLAEWFSEIPTP